MHRAWQHIRGRLRLPGGALLCFALLSGCVRHDEDELRNLLNRWFSLTETVYFQSRTRCTAAVFGLRMTEVKSALRLEDEITRALFSLRRTGVMALTIAGQSPDQTFLTVINADRSIGIPVQVAAAKSRDCMDRDTKGAFHAALSNQQSLFVWHEAEAAIIIMDPQQKRVILASGVN